MRVALVLTFLITAAAVPAVAQRDSVLAHRWVGTHLGRPLHFEFYSDTMLVVGDRHVLDYRLTRDSLIAIGDTTVVGRYRLSFGHLLLTTPDGVVTMATQSVLARPLTGRWTGPLGTDDGAQVEIRLFASGLARWRVFPTGPWATGEWDREFRIISFLWEVDEAEGEPAEETEEGKDGEDVYDGSEWRALYDPIGNALQFERTVPEGGTTILRRTFR